MEQYKSKERNDKGDHCDEVGMNKPPERIPDDLLSQYTLGGKIDVIYKYYDNRMLDDTQIHNTPQKYQKVFKKLNKGTFEYYGNEIKAVLQAFDTYFRQGSDIIVWGLAGCNCEAIALHKLASKVYVIDYNKPICDDDRIESMSHSEAIEKEISADFAISYSSFEHDGLGRYGDPLNPDGDLFAMSEAHRFLKDDGILFLGVPLGRDCLVWNAHRIYGRYRLPLLLKGWQLIDVFDIHFDTKTEYRFYIPLSKHLLKYTNFKKMLGYFFRKTSISKEYPFNLFVKHGYGIQNVMVLKKITSEYPCNDYLLKPNYQIGDRNTLCQRINKVIYDYKNADT